MLKLAKLTDYATLLMTALASAPQQRGSAQELAGQTGIGAPTVSKLLKTLQRGGLVQSTRGAHGGYQLARAPEAISVADIITAVEGPIALTDCSSDARGCGLEHACSVRGNWRVIDRAVRGALEAVSLAQMAGPAPLPNASSASTATSHATATRPALREVPLVRR